MSVPGEENGMTSNANGSQETIQMTFPTSGSSSGRREELATVNSGAVFSNAATTDPAKTPRGEGPPMLDQRLPGLQTSTSNEATPIAHQDYFVTQVPSAFNTETPSATSSLASPLQSAGASSSSLHSNEPVSAPAAAGSKPADSNELFSRLIKVQSRSRITRSVTSGSASNPSAGPSRPTTKSNRPEGPQYPDQSFAALHRQAFTPPYPYLRSNSPFTSIDSHASASPTDTSQEQLPLSGPSRTEGNTPVESPGLFNSLSASRRGRIVPEEMETSEYKAPSLHPTYHIGPKESHSLRKDFDAMTGHKLINNYEVLRELGKGTHGKVKLARPLGTNVEEKVAIKIVKRFRQRRLRIGARETQEDRVKKEIAVLKKARHHHVVSLLEVIDDPDADKVYMILEYVEEGEMKWRRKADKWTVDFERHRIEREKAAWHNMETIDADEFANEVQYFNSQREQRAAEKRRILQQQKRRAADLISSPSRRSSTVTMLTDDEQMSREFAAKWSLEHGGDSETEGYDHDSSDRASSSMSLAQHASDPDTYYPRHDFEPTGGLEVSTILREPRFPGSAPMSPLLGHGVSHPSGSTLSETQLSESMEADSTFLAALKAVQREDDANTFEREDKPYRHVPCLSMTRCRECFRDTVLGLEYLHYQGIIHRDIKPANLLWDKQHRVKISDFGVSYLGHSPRGPDQVDSEHGDDEVELAKTVGTPAFYAPELCDPDLFLDGRDNRRQIGTAMDVWALGVTLYCMIFARLPFDDPDNNEMALFHKIAKDDVFIPRMRPRAVRLRKTDGYEPKDRDEDALEYEEIGVDLLDLLKRLLHKNPKQRITIPEIKRHPWVVKGMENLVEWLDETDPAHYISDRRIRITREDVHAAMQPMSVFERMKQGVKRLSSLVRGERPRGRDGKEHSHHNQKEHSIGASSRASPGLSADPGSRRSSLRGDEVAYALRASRPENEHPLSQSQVASPIHDLHESYFGEGQAEDASSLTPMPAQRPSPVPRGGSTSESVMTIRAAKSRGDLRRAAGYDTFNAYAPHLPTGGGIGIYGRTYSTRPSHGLASKRSSTSTYSGSGTSSDNLSGSFDEAAAHASPSIAMSVATAMGSLAAPSVLHETSLHSPSRPSAPLHYDATRQRPIDSAGTFGSVGIIGTQTSHGRQKSHPQVTGRQRAVSAMLSPRPSTSNTRQSSEDNIKHVQEMSMRRENLDWLARLEAHEQASRPVSRTMASECPPSPDDEIFIQGKGQGQGQLTSTVSTEISNSNKSNDLSRASSSDDAPNSAVFSDGSRHPSMPSVISSVGGSADVDIRDFQELSKQFDASRPSQFGSFPTYTKVQDSLMSTGETVTPAMAGMHGFIDTAENISTSTIIDVPHGAYAATAMGTDEDETGYCGDQDADEEVDSDDEGIVFGGRHA